MQSNRWLGLDVGGANIKASSPDGKWALELPFPLWRVPEKLAETLETVRWEMGEFQGVAVTMTGELCDCFETKSQGVCHILNSVEKAFQGKEIRFWSVEGRFMASQEALSDPLSLAASNWLALAEIIGSCHPEKSVLLVDMGSTTTDVLFVDQGVVQVEGRDDSSRLKSGALVYTGMTRTPLCSLVQDGVCAEVFATTLDAHLILGNLLEDESRTDSADGRPWTRVWAEGRLARMLGGDLETTTPGDRRALAEKSVDCQWSRIRAAMVKVCQGKGRVDLMVLAGQGSKWVGSKLSRDPSFAQFRIVDLDSVWGSDRSRAACACAVAMLAERLN